MAGKLHGTPDRPEEALVLARGGSPDPHRTAPSAVRRIRNAALLLVSTTITTWIALLIYAPTDTTGTSAALLLGTALAIVVLNAIAWPLISRVALMFSVWTLGLAGVLLNAILVAIAINVMPGAERVDLLQAFALTLVIVVVNALLAGVFGAELESEWFLRSVRRSMRRRGELVESEVPGVLFLEIDGLSARVMRRALRDGYLPTLARWLRSGSHRMIEWECDLSSQTSASQAGLLLGSNEGIPAFRWYDRTAQQVVVSSSPSDVAKVESRLSSGNGLLADGGASRVNLFTGDADRVMFTLAKIGPAGRRGARDYQAYFSQPFHVIRTLVAVVQDVLLELWNSADQRRRNVWPRIHRHGTYPLLRAFTTVIQRDIAIAALEQDILRGTPRAYATFVGYDEVAHHSGVERVDALGVLRRLDSRFAKLERTIALAPRPYHLVVLSDHGQVQGATFQQRYGRTLEDLVREIAELPVRAASTDAADDESHAHVTSLLGDVGAGSGMSAAIARAADAREREERLEGETVSEAPGAAREVLVLPSGNLANVYVSGNAQRLTREELDAQVPGLVDTLAQHPGVGFVMVRTGSGDEDAMVIGARGTVEVASGRVEGEDPLAPYGEHALHHLRRTNRFTDVGDLLAMGAYDPKLDEVTAFEQLCGSHGGLGGGQARPFALFPSGWYEPSERIVGAGTMHKVLKRWLHEVGQDVVLPEAMDELPAPV